MVPIAMSVGAVLGSLSRYYLTVLLARRFGTRFPYGTFVINLSGSLLMGFFATLALSQIVAPYLQLLIMTGFLGSYTTFSTYALDTANLARSRTRIVAFAYWAGSAVGGGLCLEVGIGIARWLL